MRYGMRDCRWRLISVWEKVPFKGSKQLLFALEMTAALEAAKLALLPGVCRKPVAPYLVIR
eukprot:1601193-Pleurochrysis_carterae.AAC.1